MFFVIGSSPLRDRFLLLAGLPVEVEVAAEGLPALIVSLVQLLAGLQTPFSDGHAEGGLEHERLEEPEEYSEYVGWY